MLLTKKKFHKLLKNKNQSRRKFKEKKSQKPKGRTQRKYPKYLQKHNFSLRRKHPIMKMGGYMRGSGIFGEKDNATKLKEYKAEMKSLEKMTAEINKFIENNIIDIEGSNEKLNTSESASIDSSEPIDKDTTDDEQDQDQDVETNNAIAQVCKEYAAAIEKFSTGRKEKKAGESEEEYNNDMSTYNLNKDVVNESQLDLLKDKLDEIENNIASNNLDQGEIEYDGNNYQVIDVRGDGNCLFTAFLTSLILNDYDNNKDKLIELGQKYGWKMYENENILENQAENIQFIGNFRQVVVKWMCANSSKLNNLNEFGEEQVKKTIEALLKDTDWSNENEELYILAKMFDVCVINYDKSRGQPIRDPYAKNDDTCPDPIVVVYNGEDHYMASITNIISMGGADDSNLLTNVKKMASTYKNKSSTLSDQLEPLLKSETGEIIEKLNEASKLLDTYKDTENKMFAYRKMKKVYEDTLGSKLKIVKEGEKEDDIPEDDDDEDEQKKDTGPVIEAIRKEMEIAKEKMNEAKEVLNTGISEINKLMDNAKVLLDQSNEYYESNMNKLDISTADESGSAPESSATDSSSDATDSSSDKKYNLVDIKSNTSMSLKRSYTYLEKYMRKVRNLTNELYEKDTPMIGGATVDEYDEYIKTVNEFIENNKCNDNEKKNHKETCQKIKKQLDLLDNLIGGYKKQLVEYKKEITENTGIEMSNIQPIADPGTVDPGNENVVAGGGKKEDLETALDKMKPELDPIMKKITKLRDEISSQNKEKDEIKNNFTANILNKIASIDQNTPLDDIEKIIGTSNNSGSILTTYSNFKQEYTDDLNKLADDNSNYNKYSKIIDEIETNKESGVAETIKYDEIKILVESGSYTVEQSRHLNSMQSLFTDKNEEDFAIRARSEIQSKKTKQLVSEVEKEIRTELDENKGRIQQEVEENEKARLEAELKNNPELGILRNIDSGVKELKTMVEKEDKLVEAEGEQVNDANTNSQDGNQNVDSSGTDKIEPAIVTPPGSPDSGNQTISDDNDLNKPITVEE